MNCNSACQWYQQTTHLGCELRSSAAMIVAWFTFLFVSTTWYGSMRLRHRNLCECAIFSYLFNDSITTKFLPCEVPENPPLPIGGLPPDAATADPGFPERCGPEFVAGWRWREGQHGHQEGCSRTHRLTTGFFSSDPKKIHLAMEF